MKILDTNISDVKIIEPTVFGGDRGFFMEIWQKQKFEELVTGYPCDFVQDNHSNKDQNGLSLGKFISLI